MQHVMTDNFPVNRNTRIAVNILRSFGADGEPIGDRTMFTRSNYGVSRQPCSAATINKLASRHNTVTPSPVVGGTCGPYPT